MSERASLENGAIIYRAMKDAGVNLVLYLPDSTVYPIQKLAEEDPEMLSVCCAREDEGVAIAGGAAFAGGRPAIVVDSSGVGWSAYILSECLQYRLPMLVISSHSEALGEIKDYHNVARVVSESIYRAVNVPYTVVMRLEDAPMIVKESMRTALGQRMPVGVALPPHVMGA